MIGIRRKKELQYDQMERYISKLFTFLKLSFLKLPVFLKLARLFFRLKTPTISPLNRSISFLVASWAGFSRELVIFVLLI
jgi:hypothetical protein